MKIYSLVIQGPILSKGRTGKTYLEYKSRESKNLIVEYNCIENIQRLLRAYNHLFKKIVIVTWADEQIETSDVAFCDNCTLLKIEDVTTVYKNSFHPTGQINLLRQYLSLKTGIQELNEESDEHFIVKLRTDQFVDLEMLLKNHNAYPVIDKKNKIYTPYIGDYELSDFYFVASKKNLLNFCNVVMDVEKYPQFNIGSFSVHIMMALLLWSSKENEKHNEIINVLFLRSYTETVPIDNKKIPNSKLWEDYVDKLDEYFAVFPFEVNDTLIWRGDKMILPSSSRFSIYGDNKIRSGSPLDAYNFFLYCSFQRYFKNKGPLNLRVLLGLANWGLMKLFPLYKKRIISRIEQYANK